jgi:membrane-associated protein
MPLRTFLGFSIGGAFLWVAVGLGAGFFFGNIELVKKNFSLVVLGIIFVSLLPAFFEWLRGRRSEKSSILETNPVRGTH